MAWPGLAWVCLAWLGYGVAWPGCGVAWLGYGVAWLGMVWSGWVPMRAMNNLKILRTSPGQATPKSQDKLYTCQARPHHTQAKPRYTPANIVKSLFEADHPDWPG